jgi:hypothetical protein
MYVVAFCFFFRDLEYFLCGKWKKIDMFFSINDLLNILWLALFFDLFQLNPARFETSWMKNITEKYTKYFFCRA